MKFPKSFYASKRAKKSAKANAASRATSEAARMVVTPPDTPSFCERISEGVNSYIARKCTDKANTMTPLGEDGACPCSGDADASGGVDLIVLIDKSGSMTDAITTISSVAPRAFETARERCDARANVTYLYCDGNDVGVETSNPTGIFLLSHEEHLVVNAGASSPFASDSDGIYGHEQGGKAIADLCEHNNWTPGNCRAILYISDEKLDSINGTTAESRSAADMAIAAANTHGVTIFSHFIDGWGSIGSATGGASDRPTIAAHYQDMSDQTGGIAQIDNTPTVITDALYTDLIARAICEGCGNSGGCSTAAIPELEPCVSVRWGDSACDGMEGDDHEEVCITICNCYDNVTFSNVKIAGILITDASSGNPPTLPDGSPSSEIYPVGPYCFGDIDPCVDGEKTCVSRNAVIINRGLPPGTWMVKIVGLCFDVHHHYDQQTLDFTFEVCKN